MGVFRTQPGCASQPGWAHARSVWFLVFCQLGPAGLLFGSQDAQHQSDFGLLHAVAPPRPGSMGTRKNLAWGEPDPAAPFVQDQPG